MFSEEYLTRKKGVILYDYLNTLKQIYAFGALRPEELQRYRELNKQYKEIAGVYVNDQFPFLECPT